MEEHAIRFEFMYSKEELRAMSLEEREKYEYEMQRFDMEIFSDDTKEKLEKEKKEIYIKYVVKFMKEHPDLKNFYHDFGKRVAKSFEKSYIQSFMQIRCQMVLALCQESVDYSTIISITGFNREEIDYICAMREACKPTQS